MNTQETQKEYSTVTQLAARLNRKPKTIYNWLCDGTCPIAYTVVHGKKLFAEKDIQDYLSQNRVAAA